MKKQSKRVKIEDGVVMHGEATGHRHQLAGGAMLWEEDGQRIVDGCHGRMMHEEHKPSVLADIEYDVSRVLEYDHFAEEARQVVD